MASKRQMEKNLKAKALKRKLNVAKKRLRSRRLTLISAQEKRYHVKEWTQA